MELTNLLQELLVVAALLIALTAAFTEVIKKTVGLKKRYLPITSVVTGIIIGLIVWPLTTLGLYYMLVVGFISGLAASGTFDIAKSLLKRDDKNV